MSANRQKSSAVRGTNDSSTLSKCSMMQHGYFTDNYLKYFAAKTVRRAPLIHRGYFIRTKVVDWTLQLFLHYFNDVIPQVVSLGAGYDSSCFRLLSEGAKSIFVEVDYPQTVGSKCAIIKSTPNLLKLLEDPTFDSANAILPLRSRQYNLVGVDLCDISLLEKVLLTITNPSHPTLFLSECVMTYMDVMDSQRLIKWCSDKFTNALFVTYEQIQPTDGFGLVMQEHFRSLGSPLKAINSFPTLHSQEQRYIQAGFEDASARDMNSVYYSILDASEQQRIENLEVFDEFPEWHLKCAHYTLVVAGKGKCFPLQQQLTKSITNSLSSINDGCQGKTFKLTKVAVESDKPSLSRYGHSSVMLTEGMVVMLGGYGPDQQGKHSRINSCLAVYCGQWRTSPSIVAQDNFPSLMHHTATMTSTGSVIVFGGRNSPTNVSNICYQLNSIDSLSGDDKTWQLQVANTKGHLPQPRYKHSAVSTWMTDGSEVIVVFGGRSDNGEALNDCCMLDVSSLTWREVTIDGQTPTARFSHSSFAWQGNVFIVGGLGSDFIPLNSIYKLTIQSTTRLISEKIEWPNFPSLYSSTVTCHDDIAYLVGGIRCQFDGTVGVIALHLPSMTWSQCNIEVAPDCQPIILANHTAHYWRGNIIIFGGGGNCFSFGTHYNSVYSIQIT